MRACEGGGWPLLAANTVTSSMYHAACLLFNHGIFSTRASRHQLICCRLNICGTSWGVWLGMVVGAQCGGLGCQ